MLEMIYIGSEICITYHRDIQGMSKVRCWNWECFYCILSFNSSSVWGYYHL